MLFRYLDLLYGFDSDTDELDLSYGNRTFKIRKISRNELRKLMLSSTVPFENIVDLATAMGENKYWIDYCYEIGDSRKAQTKAFNMADITIEKFVLTLRLFKSGSIHNIFPFKKIEGGAFMFFFSPRESGAEIDRRPYSLNKSKLSKFQEFRKNVEDIAWEKRESKSALGIALSRFIDGYERKKLEDKVIDYMIGLEALYLKGEWGELSYKMAHRASVLLSDKEKNQRENFKKMKHSYTLRSQIVHGEEYDLTREDVWFIEDKLRDSIRKFLSIPIPKSEKAWSEIIFS